MPRGAKPGERRGGRAKGTPNKVTEEVRELCERFVMDEAYQAKLLADFRRRKLHPSIEAMLWHYAKGKPKDTVAVEGQLGIDISVVRETLSSRLASLADRLRARSVADESQ